MCRPRYRLTFRLPLVLHLSVQKGRHSPCLHGCVLNIDDRFQATIDGPSRDQVFEQARRFLLVAGKGHGPMAMTGVLASAHGGRDSWSIVVNSAVTFSPTSLPPDIDALASGDTFARLATSA